MNTSISHIAESVCLAFIHSFWQGFAIFLVMHFLLRVTKNLSSSFRYKLIGTGCLVFLGAFAYTLYLQINYSQATGISIYMEATVAAQQVANEKNAFFQPILDWCQQQSTFLMGAWLIIVLLKTVMLIRSLQSVKELKRKNLVEIQEEWKHRWNQLVAGLNIRVVPHLSQSYDVIQPIVIGWIKPVILVPVGFFNQLTPEEAEAILLHELAHVKRYDYLVNLLQVIFETVFFFNPFVSWLSSRLRKEREFSCDQWAADKLGNKTSLIRALLSFHQGSAQKLALAFGHTGYPLTQRARQLLREPAKKIHLNKIVMTAFITAASLLLYLNLTPLLNQSRDNNDTLDKVVSTRLAVPIKISAEIKPPMPAQEPGQKQPQKFSTVFAAGKETRTDTIPAGASKDWIAGYQAAMNYRDHSPTEKFMMEKSLANSRAIDSNLSTIFKFSRTEAENKKRIEREAQRKTGG